MASSILSKKLTLAENFERRLMPEPMSGCWLWLGNRLGASRGGYGVFTCRPYGFEMHRAHRVSWQIYRGPITSEQHVLHRCDNVLCVNPDHLFLGDQVANMADKVEKKRQRWGERHGMHKLTAQQAMHIRRSSKQTNALAVAFKVSETTIRDIQRRRSWANIE